MKQIATLTDVDFGKGGDEMSSYTPVKCTNCGQVIHIHDMELPDGLRPGEWFERECKKCDGTCMELAEDDSQAGNK